MKCKNFETSKAYVTQYYVINQNSNIFAIYYVAHA